MTFTHPWVLLLLAIPVMLFWSVLARPAGIVAPADHLPSHRDRTLLRGTLAVFETIPLLILVVALVMLAGPQTLQQPKRERSLTNITICLDVSGSMTGRNYQLASKAVEDFTRAREGDAFGLTLFGVRQIRWLPLTKDLQAIRNALPFANPENQPSHMGGTAIGAALQFCGNNMVAEASTGDRMIILVSDGMSFDLGGGVAEEIGDELKAAGITVYHIHIDESEVPSDVLALVELTGGQSFAATDQASLQAIFKHIDRMKPATFSAPGTVPLDRFAPFAIALLILCATHAIGLLGVRWTPW
jgi:Ca-activated chloride channel family protein